ncbi:MAG: ABC transporter permease [bacterium]
MSSRIIAVAKKEIKQLKRDTRMLFVLLCFPVFLLVIFGYAVNFDVHHIKIAVFDKDNTEKSRDFVNILTSSDYFDVVGFVSKDAEIKFLLDNKIAQSVIVIPEDFTEKIYNKKEEVKLQFLIDGVDGNTALIMQNYINSATLSYNAKIQTEFISKLGLKENNKFKLEPQFWFNPELKSTKFLIPGLIGMILIITAIISVSLSLVREKEKGTIEQINVSSITTLELLIGKATPYILFSLFNAIFVLFAGYLLFDVVIKGNYLLLLLSTSIFLVASVSIGIFVSVISDSQQIAFTISTFISLLPSLLLSGFIFPIESMPFLVQIITNITPVKFYIITLRAIILRGVGITAFYDQLLYMLLFVVVFIGFASIINYKKNKIA